MPPERQLLVERLNPSEHHLIRELLVELYEFEQPHYTEHPQLSRPELESVVDVVPGRFTGENVVLVVREGEAVAGFCWCVIFDPGSGLEGEVAEVFV
ncbi:MAG: hypothetical protein M3Z13_04855, partial [Candidatus Dormibacteraeota bacterium]|nr:hypothetical protein [Candidatus Dormibacteraeota bacterium]